MLLNFLIAIVSQSYDSIMDSEMVETTKSKIYMNNEAAIIFDAIDLLFKIKRDVSNVVHIIADMAEYDDNGDDFQGFVRTMKNAMKKEAKNTVKAVNEKIGDLDKKVVNVQEENASTKESVNEMMLLMKKIDNKFNKMASKLISGDPNVFDEEERIFRQDSLTHVKALNRSKSVI